MLLVHTVGARDNDAQETESDVKEATPIHVRCQQVVHSMSEQRTEHLALCRNGT